jgi:ferredoxin-NADP reductase
MDQIPVQLQHKQYFISYINKETPDVSLFRFEARDATRIDFRPGMFVMLEYSDESTGTRMDRAYSLASAPQQDFLEFIIGMIHGQFTSHLDTAKVGDAYYVTGPYGQFAFDPEINKKVLFLAGGTGIAPFISMLREIKLRSSDTDVCMLYSVRYPNEIIRKAELEELSRSVRLKFNVTVTRPQTGDGWTGEKGHICADMIKRLVPDYAQRAPYVCGPLAFAEAIRDALVVIGVPLESIKADIWG